MSHMEDDEPPIKSHPASKEYRANYDTIDWGEDVAPSRTDPDAFITPSPIDPKILETLENFKPEANKLAVREYLASGGEPSPIGVYGVVHLERRLIDRGDECTGMPGNDLDGEPYIVHDERCCKK